MADLLSSQWCDAGGAGRLGEVLSTECSVQYSTFVLPCRVERMIYTTLIGNESKEYRYTVRISVTNDKIIEYHILNPYYLLFWIYL